MITRRGLLSASSGLLVAGALLAGILGGVAMGAGVSPGLPPQPGTPIAKPTCTRIATPTWHVLHSEFDSGYELRIDPDHPCVEYLARTPNDVLRSTDGGRTWQQVFHDTAATCAAPNVGCLTPFTAGLIDSPGGGVVAIGETGNGNALVLSTDYGATWSLANGGITGLDGRQTVALQIASDDKTAYAIARLPGPEPTEAIYATGDGGATWTPGQAPAGIGAGGVPLIAIDPSNPMHAWVLVPAPKGAAPPVLLETSDGGRTWTNPTASALALPATSGFTPVSFIAIKSDRHFLRLLVATTDGPASSNPLASTPQPHLLASDSDGLSWANAAAAPDLGGLSIAADPFDQDRALYAGLASTPAGPVLTLEYSIDGFDTAAPFGAPFLMPYLPPSSPLAAAPVTLQSDQYGGFYLLARHACFSAAIPACPAGAQSVQSVFDVVPELTSVPSPGGGGGNGGGGVPPPGIPMVTLESCSIPDHGHGTKVGESGAMAYDGVDLLYTEIGELGPTPLQGVIHRLNPATCNDDGDIVVSFSRADIESADICAKVQHPNLPAMADDLTYDSNHDQLYLTLQANDGSNIGDPSVPKFPHGTCVFRVTLTGMTGSSPRGVAHLDWLNGCGGGTLSYDQFDNTLWTCDNKNLAADPTVSGGHISAATGVGLGGCLPRVGLSGPSAGNFLYGTSTWVVAAPHRVYLEAEDDQTIIKFDSVSCSPLAYYSHDPYSEARGEQEQMACDPNSHDPKLGPVIWLRDAAALTMSAYRITDGYCPLPTLVHLVAPSPTAVGQAALLCGHLTMNPRLLPIGGVPLSFIVDGRVVATGTTRADGTGCAQYSVDVTPGVHTLRVLFPGVTGYTGSSDDGTMDAVPGPPPPDLSLPPVGIVAAAPPPAPAPPQPPPPQAVQIPVSQAQPASQAQAQAQAAASTQEEQQVQLAAAMISDGGEKQAEGYAMTALGSLGLGVLMWFGVGGVLRRRESVAPRRSRRRR